MIKNYWNKGKKQKRINIIAIMIISIALLDVGDDYQHAIHILIKFRMSITVGG